MPVLWVLWGIAFLNVVLVFVGMAVSQHWPRLAALGVFAVQLIMFAVVTTLMGGVSGLVLILRSDAGAVLIVGTVVLFVFAAFFGALVFTQLWLSYRGYRSAHRRLSRDEVLELIRAGRVRSFTRRDGELEVLVGPTAPNAAGHLRLRTRRAHPRDYLVFVAAAGKVLVDGSKIRFYDETVVPPGRRQR